MKRKSPIQIFKEEGRKKAFANLPYFEFQINKNDRFPPNTDLRHAIKSLSETPSINTIDDWQELYESKIILSLRNKKRKNPFKKGMKVKFKKEYSTPEERKARFILVELKGDRADIKLISNLAIAPIETVKTYMIEPA